MTRSPNDGPRVVAPSAPNPTDVPCVNERCPGPCCDLHEVPLLDSDIERLAAHTKQTADAFVDEADGWRLLRGAGSAPGGCVFFGSVATGGRPFSGCTVHRARPAACRTYPFVLRRDESGHPLIERDGACPYAAAFDTPADIEKDLVGLWNRLVDERSSRLG